MALPEAGALLRALPEPSLLLTGRGDILAANPAAGRLFGRPRDELRGTGLAELLVDPEDHLRSYLRIASGGNSPVPGAFSVRTADDPERCRATASCVVPWSPGSDPVLLLRLTPTRDAADRFHILTEKVRELSTEIRRRMVAEAERERSLAAEKAAREAAEEAGRLKDEFLAVVSHELRTPLNTILVWTSLLREELAEDLEAARAVPGIERAARELSDLVQDLLDSSQLVTGKVQLRLRRVDLSKLVHEVVETGRRTAEIKDILLEMRLGANIEPVRADPERLRQVLWNLLSNALKFTPAGGRVTVRLEGIDGHVRLVVRDTGAGISPDVLPFVFDRFRQGEVPRRRTDRGLGLGLSLVRHLVELHGGTVEAHSEGRSQGATFTVVLPSEATASSTGTLRTG